MRNSSKRQQLVLQQVFFKSANELYGLSFENRLDELLGTGLKSNTFTYLYGANISHVLNLLALNSVKNFGGRAFFVDAGNSADPYLIRREADLRRKDSVQTRKFLRSIQLTRVFTCHQLTNFVIEQLPELLSKENIRGNGNPFRFVGVSGIDFVFSEEDSSKREIENLQYLIAKSLKDIAKDKENDVMFVVASSQKQCSNFLSFSDTTIEVYRDRRSGKDKAALLRHPSRQGAEIQL